MSAETSHLTDISGGASGTAASPKKATPTKRVGDAPKAGTASSSAGRPAEATAWPTMPTVDVVKFFEDSRERMREVFEQANGRFDTLRSAARETGDVFQESPIAALSSCKDLNEQLLDLVQTEVDRGYDFLKSATEVKGVGDLMQLQSDYIRESWESQIDRGKSIAETAYSIFKQALSPLQTGFSTVVDKVRKAS